MKLTLETGDISAIQRILTALNPTTPGPVETEIRLKGGRRFVLPQPTKVVPHNKGKRRLVRHTPLHRRKCVLCGRGFLSKRSDSKFCHRPCMTHHVGTPLGDRLAHKSDPKQGKKKKPFTQKQLAAVRRNVVKARAAKLAKHRAEKQTMKAIERAAKVGTTLIKGDPLTPGLNP